MLRIYCLQQWYNLSDPGAEEALYDIQSMRAFCGLELGRDAIPDETTILNFRHLLERHDLTKAVFAAVAGHLQARGALLRGGTIVDATLIAASPSRPRCARARSSHPRRRAPSCRSTTGSPSWRNASPDRACPLGSSSTNVNSAYCSRCPLLVSSQSLTAQNLSATGPLRCGSSPDASDLRPSYSQRLRVNAPRPFANAAHECRSSTCLSP